MSPPVLVLRVASMLFHDTRKIVLIINYFVSDNTQRQEEIDFCVNKNSEFYYFAQVVSIGKTKPVKHPGVHHVHHYKRPNYRQLINYCNRFHRGDICVIANIDITFDATLLLVYEIDLNNTMLALTRWRHEFVSCDIHKVWDRNVAWGYSRDGFPKGSYTQDAWIFQAPLKIDTDLADFTMGYMGCDNKISQIATDAGYRVINPSKSIKAVHWHDSEHRTYDHDARLEALCPIVPCFIEDVT